MAFISVPPRPTFPGPLFRCTRATQQNHCFVFKLYFWPLVLETKVFSCVYFANAFMFARGGGGGGRREVYEMKEKVRSTEKEEEEEEEEKRVS